jgi:hypothetical protein
VDEKDIRREDEGSMGKGVSPDVSKGVEKEEQPSAGRNIQPEATVEEAQDFDKEKDESFANKIKLISHREELDRLLSNENVDGAIKHILGAPKLFDSLDVIHARDIREFAYNSSGWFKINDVYWALNLRERKEKKNVSKILSRLVDECILARHPRISGIYRRLENSLDNMEWRNANLSSLDVQFPLGIEEFANVYQGTILVFAGTPDSGKTAFFLDFIKRNMSVNKIHLFNSEMSEQELRIRIEAHEDISPDEWCFQAYFRSSNFGDVVFPDDINIIDYLDLGDDIPAVTRYLREIHESLGKGIALVGLQKPFGRDMGYGKELSMQLPRLYISLEYHKEERQSKATVVKCKSNKLPENMIGKVLHYKLYGGWNFEPQGLWHYPTDDATIKQRRF